MSIGSLGRAIAALIPPPRVEPPQRGVSSGGLFIQSLHKRIPQVLPPRSGSLCHVLCRGQAAQRQKLRALATAEGDGALLGGASGRVYRGGENSEKGVVWRIMKGTV